MEKTVYYMNNVIGKRINRSIYSEDEQLLIAHFTVITYDHVILLEDHGITLNEDDVIEHGPYPAGNSNKHQKVIEETVEQVRKTFDEVRRKKVIPLADIRKNILPIIHEITDETGLLELFSALQSKDDYTYRHNIAVGAITNLLGRWMGFSQKELLQLTTAALLHDVGKMLIAEDILNKPDKLTDEEYEKMKNHTVYGYDILKKTIGINQRQALVALQHHERMDGSGYPLGIKKEKIDLFSRIVSVADVFHAMTSNRVYRAPSPFYEVLFQMEKDRFGKLDPEIVRLFIEKIMSSLIGQSVLLSDDRVGTILMVYSHDPTRPLVQVDHRFVDLSKDFSLNIERIV